MSRDLGHWRLVAFVEAAVFLEISQGLHHKKKKTGSGAGVWVWILQNILRKRIL